MLSAAQAARNVVAEVQGLKRGKLMVGAIQGLAPFIDLPRLLGDFRRQFPQVEIQLCFDDTEALIEGVLNGRLDIAFTQFVETPPPELAATMLACDPLVLACPGNHPLAGKRDLTLSDIAGEAFIDLPAGHGTRQLVNQSFAAANLTRRSEFAVNDLTMQLDMVAHGLGVALVPELVVRSRLHASAQTPISFATLAEPEPCWELAVVYGKHAEGGRSGSAAAEACLRLLGETQAV